MGLSVYLDFKRIGNGVCDVDLNNEQCCLDGFDCASETVVCSANFKFAESKENIIVATSLSPERVTMKIGDGFCDSILNNAECNFDKGDCSWSSVCKFSCSLGFDNNTGVKSLMIQDGICQPELVTEDCCFDGGDCPCPLCRCPTCPIQSESLLLLHKWLGDGVCDSELDFRDCCYDMGDCWCTSCSSAKQRIGNSKCDQDLNVESCCYDFGDCNDAFCTTCPILHAGRVGDGHCDKHLFNEACCFDGFDCDGFELRCPTCPEEAWSTPSFDLTCDEDLNNEACCFDTGDCAGLDEICPNCREPIALTFGDGMCNTWYNTKECCYDNNDCVFPSLCPTCNNTLVSRMLSRISISLIAHSVIRSP